MNLLTSISFQIILLLVACVWQCSAQALNATPSGCSPSSQFYNQTINHGSSDTSTFPQQYQLYTDHFRPGGPILLYQGAEAPNFTCVENTAFYGWTESLGAIAASLEHRYFGQSQPFGNESFTVEGLSPLTLENVMLDTVSFINWIKSTVPGANASEAIVFGGSYGGYLTAVLRLNHPETIYGAISSGTPVRGFGADSTDRFNVYNWLSNVYWDLSGTVASKIKAAWADFEQRFNSGDYEGLTSGLDLCYAPNSTDQKFILSTFIAETFQTASQYNTPYPGYYLIANPLQTLINKTLALEEPISVLNASAWNYYGPMNVSCLDWNPAVTSPTAVNSVGTEVLPFDYIQCTYFTTVLDDIGPGTIFLSNPMSRSDYFNTTCPQMFGLTPPSAEVLAQRYGYNQAGLNASTRIIFAQGSYDPTTGAGPLPFPSTPDRNASKILYVTGMTHGGDLYADTPYDSPAVSQARQIELQTIQEWLGLF